MISAGESFLLVLKAMAEPEWKYTQGGFQGGVELPRNLAQRQGDCTDFTLELARQLLGQGFDVPDANKPNTTALFRNQARGFTQVPAWMARPGDIVVNRPKGHAGFFTGRDLNGHAHGIANNGSPAYPDVPGRDRPVGDFDFGPNPHFLRPIR